MVFGALVFKLSVWCGAEDYVSSLQAAAAEVCHNLNSVPCHSAKMYEGKEVQFHTFYATKREVVRLQLPELEVNAL